MDRSVIESYFHKNVGKHKLVHFAPTGKPPLKFYGVSISFATISGNDHEKADFMYELYALESGKCVLLLTEMNFKDSGGYGKPQEFYRARVIESVDNIWSFASKSHEMQRLVKFMGYCGEDLAGDSSFFTQLVQ